MDKNGQLKLSFGMIFSIILIIAFILFAFFAIKKFLEISEVAEIGMFRDDLQDDIDKIWKGSFGSQPESYSLPRKIEKVCIVDYDISYKGNRLIYDELKMVFSGNENLFFYPVGSAGGFDSTQVLHLNIDSIVTQENPYCMDTNNGKVEMIIVKNRGEALVTIERI